MQRSKRAWRGVIHVLRFGRTHNACRENERIVQLISHDLSIIHTTQSVKVVNNRGHVLIMENNWNSLEKYMLEKYYNMLKWEVEIFGDHYPIPYRRKISKKRLDFSSYR